MEFGDAAECSHELGFPADRNAFTCLAKEHVRIERRIASPETLMRNGYAKRCCQIAPGKHLVPISLFLRFSRGRVVIGCASPLDRLFVGVAIGDTRCQSRQFDSDRRGHTCQAPPLLCALRFKRHVAIDEVKSGCLGFDSTTERKRSLDQLVFIPFRPEAEERESVQGADAPVGHERLDRGNNKKLERYHC